MDGAVEDPVRGGENGRGRGERPPDETEEQDARRRADRARNDNHHAQGQDQVETGEGEDGDADEHPERMVAVGEVDTVERGAVSLSNVLRDLEVVKGIVADEPLRDEVVRLRQRRVKIDRHEDGDEDDFKEAGEARGHEVSGNW